MKRDFEHIDLRLLLHMPYGGHFDISIILKSLRLFFVFDEILILELTIFVFEYDTLINA